MFFLSRTTAGIGDVFMTCYNSKASAVMISTRKPKPAVARAFPPAQLPDPGSHSGWLLQSQTNGLSTGISTIWYDVAGSSASTPVVAGIDPANPAVFYRLRHP